MSGDALLTNDLLNAQVGVLGSMLIDDATVGDILQRVSDQDFTDARNRLIFQAIQKLYAEAQPVDALTVNEKLGGNYDQILIQLMDLTPTAANYGAYVDLLKQSARRYQRRQLGERLSCAGDEAEELEVIDALYRLSCDRPGVRITSLADCYEDFLSRKGDGQKPDYLTWGIPALDNLIYVEPGDMPVLGGYPSAGKTAMALLMSMHNAKTKRVGYFYFENNDRKLFERVVSSTTLISFGKIKRNDLAEEDYKTILDMRENLTGPSLAFVEASGMTVLDIRSLALSNHYDLVVIDYLQKVRGARGSRNLGDFERVSAISSDLQDLGRQTGITVLALSQLSRPEKKNGKTAAPGLSSLRQSGQIEQDADVVLLLYMQDEATPAARTLKVAKNKEGEANLAMTLYFDGDTQTFSRVQRQLPPAPVSPKDAQVKMPDWVRCMEEDEANGMEAEQL